MYVYSNYVNQKYKKSKMFCVCAHFRLDANTFYKPITFISIRLVLSLIICVSFIVFMKYQ